MELLRAAAEPTGVDKNTGEIHDVPQEIQKAAPVGDWRPDPEEEAAIRAAEMADAQPRATASASRPRRERGSMGIE